jgi:hypothetical protein
MSVLLAVAGGLAPFGACAQTVSANPSPPVGPVPVIKAPVGTPPAIAPTTVTPPAPTAADQEWASLQALRPPRPERLPAGADAPARSAVKQQISAGFVAQADQFKAFYVKNPTHERAGEARRQEAKALINAARAGDTSQSDRVAQLVEVVRKDATLPASARCEVVAMRQYQQVNLGYLKSDAERFAAIERIERSLIAEFPEAPNGYEALLQVARSSDDVKGNALAGELTGMTGAPAYVNTAAAKLLERYALDGMALEKLLPEAATPSSSTEGKSDSSGKVCVAVPPASSGAAGPASAVSGGETIIYAWSSTNQGSLAFARQLQKTPPAGDRLIGVDLDSDASVGKAASQAQGLAEPQIYDSTGELAARLKFDSAPLAYIAGADGKIRTVSGVRELTQLWVAARKASQSKGSQ